MFLLLLKLFLYDIVIKIFELYEDEFKWYTRYKLVFQFYW